MQSTVWAQNVCSRGFPGGLDCKEYASNVEDLVSIPGLGRSPGESHGQMSLAGYSSWGHKELDMTEWLSTAHMVECMNE